ncbi:hypothetical protein FT663_02389 [Candidozyma haemuli var. vulneris]|uniref:Derlin n=1 Tax=Candidozyma haemuli TaxID=45357 RepID=A0A2V1B0H9_9ASCO|nr:hypothetical protein CXQ85_002902 [[Candida] haemuloni]KAF3988355.1 hypothetical protein FT662_03470 [[Candida] haemuloni var. vulneris]KAF3992199.1 hypothetical protein FT663_02389 [[Candida] haemuloni var. vulneris]PVH23173.1 hypothetical protein CXQ85_002902 [[Candida] haemuloni]
MAGLGDRIAAIPPVTRFLSICTFLVCLLCSLELFAVEDFAISYTLVHDLLSEAWNVQGGALAKVRAWSFVLLQSYRLFTSFFIPLGFLLRNGFMCLAEMYFLYNFSQHLEAKSGKFRGNFPDYVWFILVCGFFINVLSLIFQKMGLVSFSCHHSMLNGCITYLWSRSYKDLQIQYQGLFLLKAYYVPMMSLMAHMVSGREAFLCEMIGIIAGYLYQSIQSDTLPFYNLVPGIYGPFDPSYKKGRKVGFEKAAEESSFPDAIFDLGYLKAPKWLYRLIGYPYDTSQRLTAFKKETRRVGAVPGRTEESYASTTGFNAFQGRGHRLGS